MPIYEYVCEPCRLIHRVHHRMADSPKVQCVECKGNTERKISAPNLNIHGYRGPTEAKYAKMSSSEEIAREKELQKSFRTISLPFGVMDDPWNEKENEDLD